MKECFKCKISKSHDLFHRHSASKDGLSTYCKACTRVMKKEEYNRNRESYLIRSRNTHKNNPLRGRARNLVTNFGMTIQMYEDMLLKQEGKCAICGSTESNNVRTSNFCVDHCHETGNIRGLLCHNCNMHLGYAKDNVSILEKSIAYLEKFKSLGS